MVKITPLFLIAVNCYFKMKEGHFPRKGVYPQIFTINVPALMKFFANSVFIGVELFVKGKIVPC